MMEFPNWEPGVCQPDSRVNFDFEGPRRFGCDQTTPGSRTDDARSNNQGSLHFDSAEDR